MMLFYRSRNASNSALDCGKIFSLFQQHKLPILQKQLPINPDFTSLAQVTNHIPVERGNVQPSGFGITAAHGDVDGTADLLIVEHIAGCFAYAVVHTESEFADTSRS